MLCEKCKKLITEGVNMVKGKAICPECFDKRLKKFWKETGRDSITIKELDELFGKEGSQAKLF